LDFTIGLPVPPLLYFWRGFQDTPLPLEVKKISVKAVMLGQEKRG
jgi:hypothetical protein